MLEITLKIKNDRLAESIIAIIKKIKEVEIFESSPTKNVRRKSKIDRILDNPYDVKDFKIYKRDEIYDRSSIFVKKALEIF